MGPNPMGMKAIAIMYAHTETAWRTTTVLLSILSSILVLLRVLARIKRSEFRKTDLILVAAWGATLNFTIFSIVNQKFMDKILRKTRDHIEPSVDLVNRELIGIVIFQASQALMVLLAKISMVLLLLDIDYDRVRLNVLKALVICLSFGTLMTVLSATFSCHITSRKQYWSVLAPNTPLEDGPKKCLPFATSLVMRTVFSALAEFVLFTLAVIMIRMLRVSKWQKFGLLCTFAVGSLSCIASALSVYYSILGNSAVSDLLIAARYYLISHTFSVLETHSCIAIAALLPIRAQVAKVINQLFRGMKRPSISQEAALVRSSDTSDPGITESSDSTMQMHSAMKELKVDAVVTAVAIRPDITDAEWSSKRDLKPLSSRTDFSMENHPSSVDGQVLQTRQATFYAV